MKFVIILGMLLFICIFSLLIHLKIKVNRPFGRFCYMPVWSIIVT